MIYKFPQNVIYKFKLCSMMQGGHILVLPSANSAFRLMATGRYCDDVTSVCVEGISPSLSLRKRLMFGGNPLEISDVKAEVKKELWNNQIAFVSRWKAEYEEAIRCSTHARIEPIRKAKIPRCDWAPIERPSNEDKSPSDRFELNNEVYEERPSSPVPFSPYHQQTYGDDVTRTNVLCAVPESCLTPPASPDSETKRTSSRNLCQDSNIAVEESSSSGCANHEESKNMRKDKKNES